MDKTVITEASSDGKFGWLRMQRKYAEYEAYSGYVLAWGLEKQVDPHKRGNRQKSGVDEAPTFTPAIEHVEGTDGYDDVTVFGLQGGSVDIS